MLVNILIMEKKSYPIWITEIESFQVLPKRGVYLQSGMQLNIPEFFYIGLQIKNECLVIMTRIHLDR